MFVMVLSKNFSLSAPKQSPILINALKDTDSEVRLRAANTLGEIGPDAKAALPAFD